MGAGVRGAATDPEPAEEQDLVHLVAAGHHRPGDERERLLQAVDAAAGQPWGVELVLDLEGCNPETIRRATAIC